MLPTIELGIIVFASHEGRAPSVSGEEAITKWTPGALSPCKSAGVRGQSVGTDGKFPLTTRAKTARSKRRGGLPFFSLDYFFRYWNPQAIMGVRESA
jgi:hypothetical protein